MTETTTAIVSTRHTFEPNTADEAFALATRLVASKLLPKAVTSPEAAFAIILAGRELGVSALASMRSIHFVDGKTILASDLMLALAKRSEHCEYFRLVESTSERATFETHRRGEPEPTPLTYTMEDAKLAQLAGKDNYRKHPAAMMRARCIGALCRLVYPDLFLGIYAEGEIDEPHALPPAPRQRVTVTATKIEKEPQKVDKAAEQKPQQQAPAAPQQPVRDDAGDALVTAFVDCIAAAQTYDDLAVVGHSISARKRDLTNETLQYLQRVYLEKKDDLKDEIGDAPPPPPPPPEPPQPEAA